MELGPWPPQHSLSLLTCLPSPPAGRLWRVPDSAERLLPVPLGVPAGEPPALLPGLPAERKCPSPRAALFTRGPGVSRILGPHSSAGVRLSPSSDLPGPVDGLWLSGDWDRRLPPEQLPGQARAMVRAWALLEWPSSLPCLPPPLPGRGVASWPLEPCRGPVWWLEVEAPRSDVTMRGSVWTPCKRLPRPSCHAPVTPGPWWAGKDARLGLGAAHLHLPRLGSEAWGAAQVWAVCRLSPGSSRSPGLCGCPRWETEGWWRGGPAPRDVASSPGLLTCPQHRSVEAESTLVVVKGWEEGMGMADGYGVSFLG